MNMKRASTRAYRMTARRDAVDRTREQILQAAFDQWRDRPFDDVTIDDIAAAAGVSRQTVHRQFGSKDDLFVAVTDWRIVHEDERSQRPTPGDVSEAVAMQVDRYEEFGDAIVRFLEMEGRIDAVDRLLDTGRQGHRAEIEFAFAAWLEQLGDEDREHAVLALYAATDVMVWKLLRRDLDRSRSDAEAVICTLVQGVLAGLEGPSEKGES